MERVLLESSIRAALLGAATGLVLALFRIDRASTRHAAWTAVVLSMLLLPAWTRWGPHGGIPILRAEAARTSQPSSLLPETPRDGAARPRPSTAIDRPPALPSPPARPVTLPLLIYFAGAVTLLVRLSIGTWLARRLQSTSVVHNGRLTSDACACPITVGWIQPVPILPRDWTAWSPAHLDAVLVHEGAHARRRDPVVQWLAALNRSIFWFHPLAWWLERRLASLAEEACDVAVLERGHDPMQYAGYLLDTARSVRRRGTRLRLAALAGMNMTGGRLALRIAGLLDGTVSIRRPSRSRTASVWSVCALSTVLFVAGTPTRVVTSAAAPRSTGSLASSALVSPTARLEPIRLPAAAGREGLRFVQSRDARQQELRGLSSADPNERAAAACALGRSASAAAIPALARLLGDGSPIPESDCWPSGDWNPALKSLRHPSPGEQAAIALASFGAPAVAVLLDALESSNPTVRSNAAWAIGEVRGGGSVDRSAAIDPLVHALTDLDPWVRKAAAFSLGEMRPRRAAGALVNALGDADATVREMAARALGELKVRNAVERLAATLLGDADAHVRRTAAWALGEIQDRSALPALVAATSDENAEVRTMVAWAISEVNQQ